MIALMPQSYPALKNILMSVFSVDVGLSETEEQALVERLWQTVFFDRTAPPTAF